MENMKSLADQLREELVKQKSPGGNKILPAGSEKGNKPEKKPKSKESESAIIIALRNYDNGSNKSMVHVRFDEKTVNTMNRFKMATQVDVTKLVSFAVKHLFDTYPEFKLIIKQFIQNTDL